MNELHHPPPPPEDRRTFLKWLTHALGAVFAFVIGAPAVAYLLDARHRKAPDSSFKSVAKLSELAVGVPRQVVILNERRDAWTLHPNDIVGRVWLVRREDNKVEAYTTICPHLGCSINHDDKSGRFICPCHNGQWDVQGKKVSGPPPRDMDTLECKIEPDEKQLSEDQRFVLVEYKNFYTEKDKKEEKK